MNKIYPELSMLADVIVEPKQKLYTQLLNYSDDDNFASLFVEQDFQVYPKTEAFNRPHPNKNALFSIILVQDFDKYAKKKELVVDLVGVLEQRGFLYLDTNDYDMLHNVMQDSNIKVERIGFTRLFRKSVSFIFGVPRFGYTERMIIAEAQKEVLKNCVYALAKDKEPILVIGGPAGEMPYPVKVENIGLDGGTYTMRADRPLPFPDNHFAIMESCHSLEHMENTEQTLREWIRALKPNGILAIIVPDGEFHAHDMSIEKPLGERCFIKWTADDFQKCLSKLGNIVDVLLFNTRNNKFDIDIVLRKKGGTKE